MDRGVPRWADVALRLLLGPDAAETVGGDLLEEYRESVSARRWSLPADLWFGRQLVSFAWPIAFGGMLLAILWRMAFHGIPGPSSLVVPVSLVLLISGRSAWRTGYVRAGVAAALLLGVIASVVGLLMLAGEMTAGDPGLSYWQNLRANRAFPLALGVLPVAIISICIAVGSVGAIVGRILRPRRAPAGSSFND